MGTIISLFGIIAFCIALMTLCYCKYIKLSDVMARKVEIIGYVLLFIVLVWELVIKNLMMGQFYTANWFYLDQKLSYMFMMLEADLGIASINEQAIVDAFYSSTQSEYVRTQMTCIDVIESVLKILSTVFIAVGRFQELTTKKHLQKINPQEP